MYQKIIFRYYYAILLIFMMIFISFIPQYFNQKAYADGLTQENLPPASVGNRQASLFVKVNPPFLTTDNRQDAYMQFSIKKALESSKQSR
jgi:hypothetical protein